MVWMPERVNRIHTLALKIQQNEWVSAKDVVLIYTLLEVKQKDTNLIRTLKNRTIENIPGDDIYQTYTIGPFE